MRSSSSAKVSSLLFSLRPQRPQKQAAGIPREPLALARVPVNDIGELHVGEFLLTAMSAPVGSVETRAGARRPAQARRTRTGQPWRGDLAWSKRVRWAASGALERRSKTTSVPSARPRASA